MNNTKYKNFNKKKNYSLLFSYFREEIMNSNMSFQIQHKKSAYKFITLKT